MLRSDFRHPWQLGTGWWLWWLWLVALVALAGFAVTGLVAPGEQPELHLLTATCEGILQPHRINVGSNLRYMGRTRY